MAKINPQEIAAQFIAMDPEEFNRFWMTVAFEWNIEDSELEMQWFFNGKTVKPTALTVISAMHSAVASGRKSVAGK